ncbi:MAG: hypothetical protein ACREI3_06430 [Nitrospirales bacterium]
MTAGRFPLIVLLLTVFYGWNLCPADAIAQAGNRSAQLSNSGLSDEAGSLWGQVEHYTDTYIQMRGKRYPFSKEVVIDTYSLEKHKNGNVRVRLKPDGTVAAVYFYGIDMPDVIKQYKR